jgi:hypothetical protein
LSSCLSSCQSRNNANVTTGSSFLTLFKVEGVLGGEKTSAHRFKLSVLHDYMYWVYLYYKFFLFQELVNTPLAMKLITKMCVGMHV